MRRTRDGASAHCGRLRCENRRNPLGLDASRPRLSWILETDRPQQLGGVEIPRGVPYAVRVVSDGCAGNRSALAHGDHSGGPLAHDDPDIPGGGLSESHEVSGDKSDAAAFGGLSSLVVFWVTRKE